LEDVLGQDNSMWFKKGGQLWFLKHLK
jgi:hypothetical protein